MKLLFGTLLVNSKLLYQDNGRMLVKIGFLALPHKCILVRLTSRHSRKGEQSMQGNVFALYYEANLGRVAHQNNRKQGKCE